MGRWVARPTVSIGERKEPEVPVESLNVGVVFEDYSVKGRVSLGGNTNSGAHVVKEVLGGGKFLLAQIWRGHDAIKETATQKTWSGKLYEGEPFEHRFAQGKMVKLLPGVETELYSENKYF